MSSNASPARPFNCRLGEPHPDAIPETFRLVHSRHRGPDAMNSRGTLAGRTQCPGNQGSRRGPSHATAAATVLSMEQKKPRSARSHGKPSIRLQSVTSTHLLL